MHRGVGPYLITLLTLHHTQLKSQGAEDPLDLLSNVGLEPVQSLVETFPGFGDSGLNVPVPLLQGVETELVRDLGGVHGVRQVLLVGENQKHGVSQVVLVQHFVELVLVLVNTISIVGIDHEDQALRVLEVVPPERSNLGLSTDVPHGERDVLVLDGLHVEPDGWDGGDDLSKLQLVQDGGLTRIIKAHHENTHLLLVAQLGEELREREPHACFK
mmetsp:Transcript_4866/g.14537  ORF Transcript_4866/g.14537 Transcript_4866/m.14537 type:complete len:215 (+) Transcript_4866:85-729(+)